MAFAGTSAFLKMVNSLTESEHSSVETLLSLFVYLWNLL